MHDMTSFYNALRTRWTSQIGSPFATKIVIRYRWLEHQVQQALDFMPGDWAAGMCWPCKWTGLAS